jgi:hypothetical protein
LDTLTLVQLEDEIRIRNSTTKEDGSFDPTTGVRFRGTLDISPQDVLYRAWRQKQSPKFSEIQLRKMWESSLDGGFATV